jgi:MinD-like ATPase involved in chromosome partitioning or flagellar assembly
VDAKELGFSLLPGSKEVAGVVQPGYQRKLKLLRHLRRLRTNVVICDLGGNSNLDTLDLFNLADTALIVTSPEPTSVQNSYGFIKASILRKVWQQAGKGSIARELIEKMWDPTKEEIGLAIDELIDLANKRDSDQARLIRKIVGSARFEMIVNMADVDEARVTYQSLSRVTRKFLGIQVNFLGFVESDERIHRRIMRGKPPLIGKELFNPRMWRELLNRFEPATAVGINEEIRVGEEILHIQTEDLGSNAAAYHALVYSGGRILLSKRVAYGSPFLKRADSDHKKDKVNYLHRTVIQALKSGRINLTHQLSNGEKDTENGAGHASS